MQLSSRDEPPDVDPPLTTAPERLLRAELVRALFVEGAHFRGNAVLAIALPQIVSTPASIERLALLRDGLAGLTALADGRSVTGRVPPVALVRAAVDLLESVAPFETIDTVVDLPPDAPLVGDNSDLSLLLVVTLLIDARRRVREQGRSSTIRVGLRGEPGSVDVEIDADVGPTSLDLLYELAGLAASSCGAALESRGPLAVPLLRLAPAE